MDDSRPEMSVTQLCDHGDLLVPSFETAGLGPETDHLSPSYDLLNKWPFFTRSWASRNKMARSSILGPASFCQCCGEIGYRFLTAHYRCLGNGYSIKGTKIKQNGQNQAREWKEHEKSKPKTFLGARSVEVRLTVEIVGIVPMSDTGADFQAEIAKLQQNFERFMAQQSCSYCGGPFNSGNCPSYSIVGAENEFVRDPNPITYDNTPDFYDQPPQPQYGFDCPPRLPLVYEQEPSYNHNFGDNIIHKIY
ncbi:hypothetical protein Tco_0943530 [Tanacetum coccineum]